METGVKVVEAGGKAAEEEADKAEEEAGSTVEEEDADKLEEAGRADEKLRKVTEGVLKGEVLTVEIALAVLDGMKGEGGTEEGR